MNSRIIFDRIPAEAGLFLFIMKYQQPSGILIVDKPERITSAAVVNRIKRFPEVIKAGHAGTLDPFATGVMLCLINQATRLSRFLLHGWKTYDAVMVLGVATDTQDATGNVIKKEPLPELGDQHIRAAAKRFLGEISQMPPVYSALKHNGKPLYEYARDGRPIQKPARRVTIDRIAIDSIDLPEVRFTVCCSSGTYIRTLCADIGQTLGCGAHLKDLRRTESSDFRIEEAEPLEKLEQAAAAGRLSEKIVPMADALRGMTAVTADKALTERIKYGKIIYQHDVDDIPETDYIKVLDTDKNLLAVLFRSGNLDRLDYCCVFHHG